MNTLVPAYSATTAFAANSADNPPQSIAEKTDVATWSYTTAAQVTAANGNFAATSGFYKDSMLQLFKNNTTQITSGFDYSTSSINTTGFDNQADKAYWYLKTSTVGFKDLVFNFSLRSSGTAPRDFNTEWSTDAKNWNVFGKAASTGFTVKIATTTLDQFGMVLPEAAANQDNLYIRIIQKSNVSQGNGTVACKRCPQY